MTETFRPNQPNFSLLPSQYIGEVAEVRRLDHATLSTVSTYTSREGDDAGHTHQNLVISFVVSGDSDERLGGRLNARTVGQITYIPPREIHQVCIRRFPSRVISIELEEAFLTKYNIAPQGVEGCDRAGATFRRQIFLRLFSELSAMPDADTSWQISAEMLLLQMLGEDECDSKWRPRWIDMLEDLIRDTWNEPMSLAKLSSQLGVHPVTISKSFSRYFGSTFGEYLRRLRVEKTLEAVLNDDATLTQIAIDSGFADQSHYTRTFKTVTGMTPKKLRSL